VDWYVNVLTLIDLRSFSNLWYWIALAAVWSSTSHFVMGAPWDLVQRAARQGGQPMADVEALVAIYMRRVLYVADRAGAWLLGVMACLQSLLFFLGFLYSVEFCQALFLIAFPVAIVMGMRLGAARRMRAAMPGGAALVRVIRRQRLFTQIIGMVSIFVTAMWGMYQNLSVGVLGG